MGASKAGSENVVRGSTYIGYPNRLSDLGFRYKVNAIHTTTNILENCIAFYFSFLKCALL